ncbi:MAG: hypothetical protein HY923_02600 [Elusimicrobia bacterium]|nr:hypothetical protein [Elusimicrobiota bacterium]
MKYKIKDLIVSVSILPPKGRSKKYVHYLACGSSCGNTCDWNLSVITRNHGSATEEMSFYSALEKQLASHLARLKKSNVTRKKRLKLRKKS